MPLKTPGALFLVALKKPTQILQVQFHGSRLSTNTHADMYTIEILQPSLSEPHTKQLLSKPCQKNNYGLRIDHEPQPGGTQAVAPRAGGHILWGALCFESTSTFKLAVVAIFLLLLLSRQPIFGLQLHSWFYRAVDAGALSQQLTAMMRQIA